MNKYIRLNCLNEITGAVKDIIINIEHIHSIKDIDKESSPGIPDKALAIVYFTSDFGNGNYMFIRNSVHQVSQQLQSLQLTNDPSMYRYL